MNVSNFMVRPKRKLVEKYADAKAWETLGVDESSELVDEGLVSRQNWWTMINKRSSSIC